jgi:divalent metal cation (Fe/Co/Zn/Cd) transporter
MSGVCNANSIATVHLAPNSVVVYLSLDFFDTMRAPEIERAVVDLEKQIRDTHPEVSAVFVKPQSVQVARDRGGDTLMSPDFVLREDVLTGG